MTALKLSPIDARIVEAQILDGADTVTVAKRAGVTRNYANKRLSQIASGLGLGRMEMVVAFLRGHVSYEVA